MKYKYDIKLTSTLSEGIREPIFVSEIKQGTFHIQQVPKFCKISLKSTLSQYFNFYTLTDSENSGIYDLHEHRYNNCNLRILPRNY